MLTKHVKFKILADLRGISERIEVLKTNETLYEKTSQIYGRAKGLEYYLRRTTNKSEAPILFNSVKSICDALLAILRISYGDTTNADNPAINSRIAQIKSYAKKAQETLLTEAHED